MSAPFILNEDQSSYTARLRRNSNADTPIANNAIAVGSGTAFHAVAGISGVFPDTNEPSATNVLQDFRAL